MAIKVKVEQKHIDIGIPENEKLCAIAMCLKEMGYNNVRVSTDCVEMYDCDDTYFEATLPEVAKKFVAEFDALPAIEVKPIEFELNP